MFRVFHCAAILGVAMLGLLWVQKTSAQIAPTSTATISGSVTGPTGNRIVGAKIVLIGPRNTSTLTDSNGLFVVVGVPFGTYTITATTPNLGVVSHVGIIVQGDTNVAIQYQPASVNGLKTIASVQSSASFNVTPASITQVNPQSNAFTGQTSWRTILEQIPGIAQGGLGNGEYANAAVPDSPMVPMQVSINGALPYESSITLDGMPLIGRSIDTGVPGVGTDLSLYPLDAFQAADVVRGPGAASPSIVDSIGGSLVLHGPSEVSQNHFLLSWSNDPYGGNVVNALAAVRVGKLSITATYGVNNSPGPLGTRMGIPAFTVGSISTVDGRSFIAYSPPCNPPGCVGSELVDPNYNPVPYSTNSFYGFQTGLLMCCALQSTAWNQLSRSISASYPISPRINAEVSYAGGLIRMNSYSNYVMDCFLPPAGYSGPISSGEQVFNYGGFALAPYPAQESSNLIEEKIDAQVGIGTIRLAALQNQTSNIYGFDSAPSGTYTLYGGGEYCDNPTCTTTTPVIFDGSSHQVTLSTLNLEESTQTQNRDLLFSYQTPVTENFHVGASYVKSYYNDPQSSCESYDGFSLGTTVLSPAISSTINEVRLSGGGNITPKMSMDISWYFASVGYHVPVAGSSTQPGADVTYSNVAMSYNAPRLGLTWRPTAAVAVRASAGGGLAVSPVSDLVGTAPQDYGTYWQETTANPNLEPEKSFAFDVGTDIRLKGGPTLVSFDLYRTDLFGQLYQTYGLVSSNYESSGLPLLCQKYENLGVSRFEGVILDVRHEVPQGIVWNLSVGLTRGYVISVPPGFYNAPGETCNFTTLAGCANLNVVPGVNFNSGIRVGVGEPGGSSTASVPYAQGRGSVGYRWRVDKFVSLNATYYGNNNTYFRPAFTVFDADAGYPLTKNVSLLLQFSNITNIYGDAIQTWEPGNFLGTSAVAGPPFAEYGEEYGPRSLILTAQVKL